MGLCKKKKKKGNQSGVSYLIHQAFMASDMELIKKNKYLNFIQRP